MGFMDNMNSNLISSGVNHSSPNYDGGLSDFTNQVLNLHKDKVRRDNQINDAILQHQLQPINPFANPLTTNMELSRGLTPANREINTATAPSEISPTDKIKLMQGQEKIDASKSKESGELGFKQANADTANKIKQQRADIYDYKAKNPDHKFDFSGATVKVANPKDGSVYDTGVPTDKLSMEDRMNLSASQGVMRDTNRLNMTGSNNINRDNNSSQNRLGEIAARGKETRETNLIKPNTKLVSNSQVNQGYINTAQELLNSNSAYAPYIKLGKSDNGKVNGFSVNPVNGEGDPIYHEINSKIYGRDKKDVTIPSESKDESNNNSNKSDNSKKPDPLGIR